MRIVTAAPHTPEFTRKSEGDVIEINDHTYAGAVLYSDDDGRTWQESPHRLRLPTERLHAGRH